MRMGFKPLPFIRAAIRPNATAGEETWRNGPIDRFNCVPRVLRSRRTLRQPTSHGVYWHIRYIAFSHARSRAHRAAIDRTISAPRMASPSAERLSAVVIEAAMLRLARVGALRET